MPAPPPTRDRSAEPVLRRLAELSGPVYEFVDYCIDADRELSILELRTAILAATEGGAERRCVILVPGNRLEMLREKLPAVLNHREVKPLLGEPEPRVLVGVSIGGGGIGDVRRVFAPVADDGGNYTRIMPTSSVVKIVERPEKNLANTDLEVLSEVLPALTRQHQDRLTLVEGVARGLRRHEWTLVQRLSYIDDFRSFSTMLDDIESPLCTPILILEVLRQAAEGLRVLHAQGIAHRDFKADAIVVDWKPSRITQALERLALMGDPQSDRARRWWVESRRRSIRARIFDFDTVARRGQHKDPHRTTSSSENARLENPRELAEVFTESDQYPLGIAALRLLPDLWGEIRGVMRSGMAVAVPMKIMMVRGDLASRRDHFVQVYADFYGCGAEASALLVDVILRLVAFEPEERFSDLDDLIAKLGRIQRQMPADTLGALIRRHAHIFDDAEALLKILVRDSSEGAGRSSGALGPRHDTGARRTPWALAVGVGAVVVAGAVVVTSLTPADAPRPTPAPPITPPRPVATPSPRPPSNVLLLDESSVNAAELAALGQLGEGATQILHLKTLTGKEIDLTVQRGVGPRKALFSYVLGLEPEPRTFPPTTTPQRTIREIILSTTFDNFCEGTAPQILERFIRRMPAEPRQGGEPLLESMTLCRGATAEVLEVSAARVDNLTFELRVGPQRIQSRAPRQDACRLVNEVVGAAGKAPWFEDCKEIKIGLSHQVIAPPAPVAGGGAVEPPTPLPALPELTLRISRHLEDLLGAAEDIGALTRPTRVTVEITGCGSIVLEKRGGSLYRGSEELTSSSRSVKAAAITTLQETVERCEGAAP